MHLIACEVFRPELERLTRAMRNAPEVTYLEQGLHDTPDELRRRGEGPADQDQIQRQPAGVFPLAFLKLLGGEVEEDQSEHDPQMDGAQQLGVDDPEPGGKIDLEDGQTDSDNAGNALQ